MPNNRAEIKSAVSYDVVLAGGSQFFASRLRELCGQLDLSFFLVEPLWINEFLAKLRQGDLKVEVLIEMAADLELPQAKEGIGAMGHLALNLDVSLENAMETLRDHNISFMGPIDRGYESSIYLKDPNGVLVELLTWVTPLPEGANEADVIARATEIRQAAGAHHIELEHAEKAMAEMAGGI